eukprot:2420521-Rhodomonas_salina.1
MPGHCSDSADTTSASKLQYIKTTNRRNPEPEPRPDQKMTALSCFPSPFTNAPLKLRNLLPTP